MRRMTESPFSWRPMHLEKAYLIENELTEEERHSSASQATLIIRRWTWTPTTTRPLSLPTYTCPEKVQHLRPEVSLKLHGWIWQMQLLQEKALWKRKSGTYRIQSSGPLLGPYRAWVHLWAISDPRDLSMFMVLWYGLSTVWAPLLIFPPSVFIGVIKRLHLWLLLPSKMAKLCSRSW